MRHIYLFYLLLSLSVVSGCVDQTNIEDISLSLMIGIDLDDNNNLVVSSSSPVFNKEAKQMEENNVVQAFSLRQSREQFDSMITALTSRGKVQVVLIGKRIVEHPGWFNLLDTFFRDGKNTTKSRVVLVDGSVADLIKFAPADKPRLPLYLLKLIDTAHKQNITVKTSLQELHREFNEKGMSPCITVLKKDGQIKITGTALLDRSGKYIMTLDANETKLLRILQHENHGTFPFTIRLPEQPNKGFFEENTMSFFPNILKTKTKVAFKDNGFIFDVQIKMGVVITERLFLYDAKNKTPELEKQIQEELQTQIEQLLDKIQGAKIDPIGLGLYARAYEYSDWKKVAESWDEAFSNAKVNVKVKVRIRAHGSTS
ncbi:MAG: Ger(x)C family spore germination protein [Candidatus Cohnella colombiensis]|uniref:Ger(X)C family spore germination protein n=1 Tax=Candidatus Cohnella colombiensis TaxID=3121368 RepID=A0AA95EWE3_9BACL|nr:MAG: Ger(x)C family spore germination protein [Cohnella sp.]